jgi:mono/diheme cytochrome c family protein
MKRGILAGLAVIVAGSMGLTAAAQREGQGSGPTKPITVKAQRTPVRTVKVEVPVIQAVRSDTPAFRGEGSFQQKCGVCHLGRWRKAGQLQPALSLAGVFKDTSPDREAAVREQIQRGSLNMPGFQNTFTPSEFDDLIAYLKTL